MIIYLAIFFALSFLAYALDQRSQKALLLPLLVSLFWFMGWRYQVGCDFYGYLSRFNNAELSTDLISYFVKKEGAFLFITAWLKENNFPYYTLNVVASAIILFGYARYLRTSPQPITEIALLFPVIILQLSMSGLRQGIAVALLTASVVDFNKGRRLAVASWIFVGAQFHASVAIFLPLALLAGRNVSVTRFLIAGILFMPIVLFVMGGQAEDYSNQYVRKVYGASSSDGALFRYILVAIPMAYFWANRDHYRRVIDKRTGIFEAFAIITLLIAPLFLVSSLVVHRLTFYVMPISVMIAANAFRAPPPKFHHADLKLMPFLFFGAYLIGWITLSSHADRCYIPYQNYTFL
ncbi:EpsG family protein [Qipengyuania sp. CAU 1752]